MSNAIQIDKARAVAPSTAAPEAGGPASSHGSPADHYVNVEQALHDARRSIDYLYAGTCDEHFLRAVADNRGFIGPLIRQLLEINRLCEKAKVE